MAKVKGVSVGGDATVWCLDVNGRLYKWEGGLWAANPTAIAVEVAKELAKIPAERGVRRVVYPAPRSFLQQIFGGEQKDTSVEAERQRTAVINALPKEMRRTFRYAARFDRFGQGEALAILPFELDIK